MATFKSENAFVLALNLKLKMFSNAGKSGGKKALQAKGVPSLFAAPPRSFRDDFQSAKFGQKPTFRVPILAPVVAPISPKQPTVNLLPTKKSSINVNYFDNQEEDLPPVVVNNPIAEKAPEIGNLVLFLFVLV